MKITSITAFKENEVSLKQRNTKGNKNAAQILEAMKKQGGDLTIHTDDIKTFERYALQKALQKAGAKVVVQQGVLNGTKKAVLIIHELTDKEWKEYVSK